MSTRRTITEEDRSLFRTAVGTVRRVDSDRAPTPATRRPPAATTPRAPPPGRMHGLSEREPEPLAAGDRVEHAAPGLRRRDLLRLRRGRFPIEARLDLHGMTIARAAPALAQFLAEAVRQRRRSVLVIHGKGYGTAGGHAVLKARVAGWLADRPEVLAFCSALPPDGGTGALYVLLRAGD